MAKSYLDKLKDPRWQKVRLKVFDRDKFTCTLCGDDKETLHVHHEKYKGEPWEADINKLKTLCKDCHLLVTINKDINIKKAHKMGGIIFYSDGIGYGWFAYDMMAPSGIFYTDIQLKSINHFINEAKNV